MVKVSLGATWMQVLHLLLKWMRKEQCGIGLDITRHFSPAKHHPPDMTWDIQDTQIFSGAAMKFQGVPVKELLGLVFGYQDLSLCARFLVRFCS